MQEASAKSIKVRAAQAAKQLGTAKQTTKQVKKQQKAEQIGEAQPSPAAAAAKVGLFGKSAAAAEEKGIAPTANPKDIAEITNLLKHGNQAAIQAKLAKDPALAASKELFLLFIAAGEQDQAEEMLQKNPQLLNASGTVTDLSGRTFDNITGFQYAVWALDWHMWTMILKYLPEQEAARQIAALDRDGTKHGKHFDFDPLIHALETYIKNYRPWSAQQCEQHWCKQVGGAQFQLPAHAINEYCRQDRSFHPTPNFLDASLPRSMETETPTNIHLLGVPISGVWFTKELGVKHGVYRDSSPAAGCAPHGGWVYARNVRADHQAIVALSETRLSQRAELTSTLSHCVGLTPM